MNQKLEEIIKNLQDDELLNAYRFIVNELKNRKLTKSKNIVGDLGEYYVIKFYNSTPGLPKLGPAPQGTRNVDAISRRGYRYSIKATTGKVTGVFYGLNDPKSSLADEQNFEFVVVAIFDENLVLQRINELTWTDFLKFKRWHSRMRAWNLSITRELLENTKTIFKLK